MHPDLVFLFRGIFLTFLGISMAGIGSYFATKSTGEYGWLGAAAAILGGAIFCFGFVVIIALLWRHWTLG